MVIVRILREYGRCFLKNDNKIYIYIYIHSGQGGAKQDVTSKTCLCSITSLRQRKSAQAKVFSQLVRSMSKLLFTSSDTLFLPHDSHTLLHSMHAFSYQNMLMQHPQDHLNKQFLQGAFLWNERDWYRAWSTITKAESEWAIQLK